jgi:hypothetical protein
MRKDPLRVLGKACLTQGTKHRQLEVVGSGRAQFAKAHG